MTGEQINEIQSLFYSGMTKAEIARKMDCPIGRINYYTSGQYYKVKIPNHKKTECAREKIIYKGVYDFLQERKELSLYAFCQLVLNKSELYDQNRIRSLQDFLQGKHKGHFSLDVFQAICNVVGKTFEETFKRRKL